MDLGAMLADKRVLVTGASSGLGENFARLAAACKAKVVIAARRKARLDKLAQEIEGLGAPQVTVVEMDVASFRGLDRRCLRLYRRLGRDPRRGCQQRGRLQSGCLADLADLADAGF